MTLFGIEFSAFIVAQVFLQAPIGVVSDRFGHKPFIVGGLVVLVPATFAQGLVTTTLAMIATRLLQGAAAAAAFAPGFALAGGLADSGNSGTTFSVLTMAFTLGTAVGPFIVRYLVSFGCVVPFAFGAALAGLGALLVYSQAQETLTSSSKPTGGPQPTGQD